MQTWIHKTEKIRTKLNTRKWQNIRVGLIAGWNIHSSQKHNMSNNKKTSFITFRLIKLKSNCT